ncbi:tetratricopeptide repeat protein [Pendulispora brunnea]|uniref:Tetratricopeptide repeat protein n=1 Tax=Pendulispora brunnea TaxID=2905690 RepID=A0ABZ2KMD3_9BACT
MSVDSGPMTDSTNESTSQGKAERRKKRKRDAFANVIRVNFGAGGGRVDPDKLEASRTGVGAPARSAGAPSRRETDASPVEPVTDLFSAKEVARLLNLSEGRLRTLDKAQIVSPSGTRNGRRAYTFQDLIALRATLLLSKEVKPREMARAIDALKQTLPKVTRPLQELRIVSDGRKVVVRAQDGAFEPVTGQMVLDFQVGGLRDDVVRVLRPESAATRARTAYDLYVKASTLDEDPATYDEAEALYSRAIELDPELSIAYTNLGNIRFRRGDDQGAEELYQHALSIDPSQPEAHYNLGYVMLERGHAENAVASFEKALLRDTRFSDAHFNLAMALEQLGERARARVHWKRYLELEPQGTWADIARQHL